MKKTDPDIARLKATIGKEIGTGITKHLVLFPESSKDYKDIKRVRGTMPEYLDRIEAEAWGALYDSVKFVKVSRFLIDAVRKGESGYPPNWLDGDPSPDFSTRTWAQDCPKTASMVCSCITELGFKEYEDDEWFAARVVRTTRTLKASLYIAKVREQRHQFYATHPDGQLAALEQQVQTAMNLAALQTEWRLKKEWEGKAIRHEAGGDATRKKTQPAKDYAIQKATEIWCEPEPIRRIGDVVSIIQIDLERQGMTFKASTIKGWLKSAHKKGDLSVPSDASLPGANKQQK